MAYSCYNYSKIFLDIIVPTLTKSSNGRDLGIYCAAYKKLPYSYILKSIDDIAKHIIHALKTHRDIISL